MWTSTAARALQTATLIAEYLDYNLKTLALKRDLYTFEEQQLLQVIQTCNDQVQTLMVFSHNHGLTELANSLGNQRFDNVPTTGVVAIDFNVNSWNDIKKGNTQFHLFPKDIK